MSPEPDSISLNVSLPEQIKCYLDCSVASGAYASANDFVGEAIREKVQREQAKAALTDKLVEGLDSGKPIHFDDRHFDRKKASLVERLRSRNGGQ